MNELFRLKIASKRQMTAPQRLLDALNLSEGDEIQIEVSDGQVVGVHPCKAVPTTLLTDDLLSKIREREERLIQGQGMTADEALRKIGVFKKFRDSAGKAGGKRRNDPEKEMAKSR